MAETAQLPINESLAALVTIVRAAHLTGDELTERIAQRKLFEHYGVRVSFEPPARKRKGVQRDD
jgi:hypothetical protein